MGTFVPSNRLCGKCGRDSKDPVHLASCKKLGSLSEIIWGPASKKLAEVIHALIKDHSGEEDDDKVNEATWAILGELNSMIQMKAESLKGSANAPGVMSAPLPPESGAPDILPEVEPEKPEGEETAASRRL